MHIMKKGVGEEVLTESCQHQWEDCMLRAWQSTSIYGVLSMSMWKVG